MYCCTAVLLQSACDPEIKSGAAFFGMDVKKHSCHVVPNALACTAVLLQSACDPEIKSGAAFFSVDVKKPAQAIKDALSNTSRVDRYLSDTSNIPSDKWVCAAPRAGPGLGFRV